MMMRQVKGYGWQVNVERDKGREECGGSERGVEEFTYLLVGFR